MTAPYVPSEELRQLLAIVADGAPTEEQEERLAAILRNDPRAREWYFDYLALASALQWEYAALALDRETESPRVEPHARRPLLSSIAVGLTGLAAGLLLACFLIPNRPPGELPPQGVPAEPTDDCVAVVLEAPGAVWEAASMPAYPGAALPPGRLLLKMGVAHIQFYSGATVLLEGPADFRLISPREAFCTRGKLRATVPPQAQGFTIGSPRLDLVDLGTEFGMNVHGTERTEVHVFEGKVDLYDAGTNRAAASRQELTTGHGLRVTNEGARSPIVSDSSAFLTAEELAERSETQARRRYRGWAAASEKLRKDPRLLLYYTFQTEQPWHRMVPDLTPGRAKPCDGAVVGCKWTSGRWPGKQALEFQRFVDRVRIEVPGEHAALTFMTWVRIDSLEHKYTSLLLTDRWGPRAAHWQISKKGEIILNVMDADGMDNRTRTPPVLGPAHFGQWTHLTTVYDAQAQEIRYFVNGQRVGTVEILFPTLVDLGTAEIGNWGSRTRELDKVPIRNLNGRMDEFLLFRDALTDQEIQDLYQVGKPHS